MASEAAASAGRSELRTRVISAAILAPVALAAMAYGGMAFAALVALVAAIGLWEWCAIGSGGQPDWACPPAIVCLMAGLFFLAEGSSTTALLLIALPAILALLSGFWRPSLPWLGLGLIYVGIPCAAFIVLREAEPFGWAAILYVLFVVWATDIGAYFGGRTLGGPKLWPRVSPKKTWSGAISGLLAAVVAGGLVVALTGAGSVTAAIVLSLPLSIAAQAGDLFESAVKRRFGVKDSGAIIPGHGGVLDRVDGLFGAAAVAWLIAALGLGGGTLALPAAVAGGAS